MRLYELELEGTTEAKRRADLFLGLGRVLAEKLEELDAAAQRLGEVIRLRPRDEKALELLAAIYSNPNWIGADGMERAAAIFFQIARRRQEAGDADNAVAALRRALQAVPGHPESSELLERVYYDGRRYQELDRYYRERISAATSEPERIDFLYKRAQLAEGEMNDPAEAVRVYSEIANLEPPNGPAAARLVELFLASHDYAKLAELRERQLGAIEEPNERIRIMSELAALYRDRLGDRDQSAVYLHAILQLDPENPGALGAYADHFRDKGDWGALADLLEFSFERARVRGGAADEQVRRLEEIAVVSEKNLGDAERALHAWRRVEELAPTYARAREAQRRLLLKAKSWDRMAALLEREAALQEDPAQKAETLRRVAQIHREKLGDARRAVEIYKGILRAEPHDAVALRALVEIFEREGDFAGLAKVLREQIDLNDGQARAREPAAPPGRDLRRAPGQPARGDLGRQRDPADGPRRSRHARAPRGAARTRGRRAPAGRGAGAAHQVRRQPRREDPASCAGPPSWCRTSSTTCRARPRAGRRSRASIPTTPRRSTR